MGMFGLFISFSFLLTVGKGVGFDGSGDMLGDSVGSYIVLVVTVGESLGHVVAFICDS